MKIEEQMLKTLLKREQGFYLTAMALFLIAVFTVVGLAIDGGILYVNGMRTQHAADAGALIGTMHIGQLTDANLIALSKTVAQDNLELNGVPYKASDIVVTPSDNILELQIVGRPNTAIIGRLFDNRQEASLTRKAAGEQRPVALVAVADTSGSMLCRATGGPKPCNKVDGSRIEALMSAGKVFLKNADPERDAVAIVRFDTNAQVIYPMAHPFDYGELEAALNGLLSGGGTNINAGMKAGIEQMLLLKTMKDASGDLLDYDSFVKVILLVTDGGPTKNKIDNDPGDPVPYPSECSNSSSNKDFLWPILRADYARDNNIFVYTIGLGEPDTNTSSWKQGGSGNYKLKQFFMKRMANDTVAGKDDPSFPSPCIKPYKDLMNQPTAEYQTSPSGDDLLRMFNRIYRTTQTRLII